MLEAKADGGLKTGGLAQILQLAGTVLLLRSYCLARSGPTASPLAPSGYRNQQVQALQGLSLRDSWAWLHPSPESPSLEEALGP